MFALVIEDHENDRSQNNFPENYTVDNSETLIGPTKLCIIDGEKNPMTQFPIPSGREYYLAEIDVDGVAKVLKYRYGVFEFVDEPIDPQSTIRIIVPKGSKLYTNDTGTSSYLYVGHKYLKSVLTVNKKGVKIFIVPYRKDKLCTNVRKILIQ